MNLITYAALAALISAQIEAIQAENAERIAQWDLDNDRVNYDYWRRYSDIRKEKDKALEDSKQKFFEVLEKQVRERV